MTVHRARVLVVFGFLAVGATSVSAEDRRPSVEFNRDIRPILAKNCFACHGPDEDDREAGLRLDQRAAVLTRLESGTVAIVPGKPSESELFQRITSEDEFLRMPPPDVGKPLTAAEIQLIRQWILEGAEYAAHWSFVKPVRWPLPDLQNDAWPRNEIDHFILARLEEEGLSPSPEADRYTLIRRVSLDLRGLPPTPSEVEGFINDPRPDAYEQLVDRFLSDKAYGERWARLWLDLARYADSKGYGSDPLREIWRYRDWVIDALNANMPYDEFTIEQLAGDLLPEPTLEQRIATAFHRNTMTNTEGGTDDEEFRVEAVRDRVDTTMQVWMGLTMGCAKCHNHKYDPLTQREYYEFYAFFNQTADTDLPNESPTIAAPTRQMQREVEAINAQIEELRRQLDTPPADSSIEDEIARLEKSRPKFPTVPVMQELPPDEQRETRVMLKGNFLSPGERVSPAVPALFHPFPEDAPRNRLGVAKWLVHEDNPLTARVAVNRFWARLFGTGLVETEEDFGTQGELPSHPKLLDWLATEFMRENWDMKALLRLMVTSATYRQSSAITEEHLARDFRNRLLARGPRFRLEAEMVRDQALALSGLLSHKLHGPSVYPPQPPGLWRAAFNGRDRKWATSEGEDRYRRGLYTFWRRTVPYPSMATFDAPSREICSIRRIRTSTPLQAFVTLNDPVYVECAQALARRIVREGGATVAERVRYGLRLCLVRPPLNDEVEPLVTLFESERQHYREHPDAAVKIATDPLGPLPEGMEADELAAWTVVANVLLNLDGVLVQR